MNNLNINDFLPSQTNSNNSGFLSIEPLRDEFFQEEEYLFGNCKQQVANDGFFYDPKESFQNYNNQTQQDSVQTLAHTYSIGDHITSQYGLSQNNCNGFYNPMLYNESDNFQVETLLGTNSSDLQDNTFPIQQLMPVQYSSQEFNQFSQEFGLSSQEESIEPDVTSSLNPSDIRDLTLQISENKSFKNLKKNLLDQKNKAKKISKPSKAKATPKKNKSNIKDKMQRQNPKNHAQVQQKNKSPKLKLDQGFKSLLRGLRKSLFSAFEKSGFSNGFHHFTDERWLAESKAFLQGYGIMHPTDRQICALSVLLYHTLGTTIKSVERLDIHGNTQKETIIVQKDNVFHRVLGEEGMLIYKIIFDKNRTETVDQFLRDDFIRSLWPLFIYHSQEQFYFKEEAEQKKTSKKTKAIEKVSKDEKQKRPRSEVLNDLSPTLQHISWLLENEYKLTVPAFWLEKFPSAYMKKKESKKANTY